MLGQSILQRLSPSSSRWLNAAAIRAGSPEKESLGVDPQHVRMFVLSHLFGPVIGLSLTAFLSALGFPLDYRLAGFVVLVCLFWAYPAALAHGADYRLLTIVSLQHLSLTIFWASFGYGGLTSPFLLWLAVVPLLAFLYCAPDRRLWLILVAMLVGNLALFAGCSLFLFQPDPADSEKLRWLAAISLAAAFAYVAMMAIYFGRVLESRDEMALQADRYRLVAADLDRRVAELRNAGAATAGSLARIARECRAPLDEIVASSRTLLDVEARENEGAESPDLRSIDDAARHLGEVIETVVARAEARLPKW
jgi:signal transduction histidine kinase